MCSRCKIRLSYIFSYFTMSKRFYKSVKRVKVTYNNTKDRAMKKEEKHWFKGCIFYVPRRGQGTRNGREEDKTPTRCACGAHDSSTANPPTQQNRTKEKGKDQARRTRPARLPQGKPPQHPSSTHGCSLCLFFGLLVTALLGPARNLNIGLNRISSETRMQEAYLQQQLGR